MTSFMLFVDSRSLVVVAYRMENAEKTLSEVESHRANGFYHTVVNRMYYAFYYTAAARLISIGVEVESHEGVCQSIGQHLVLTGQLSPESDRFYSRLFSNRNTGDYDDFVNHTLVTVNELLPQAKQFVQTIFAQLNE